MSDLTAPRAGLDWRWIGLGAVIMVALSLLASVLLLPILGGAVTPPATPGGNPTLAPESLAPGRLAIAALLSFVAFVIGGYIVGRRSAGRTVLEPGISAALAVAVGLLIGGQFTLGNLLAGGIVPFLAGLLGGWVGERHGRAAGPAL